MIQLHMITLWKDFSYYILYVFENTFRDTMSMVLIKLNIHTNGRLSYYIALISFKREIRQAIYCRLCLSIMSVCNKHYRKSYMINLTAQLCLTLISDIEGLFQGHVCKPKIVYQVFFISQQVSFWGP